jgi:sterol desaturase/sphingolipid hydroxylase (fatty acid hydroxylase superfamily)
VRLRFDGLHDMLATPDVHRLHHLRQGATRPVNLGIVLLIFDRLFGTYRPAGPAPGADDIGPFPS